MKNSTKKYFRYLLVVLLVSVGISAFNPLVLAEITDDGVEIQEKEPYAASPYEDPDIESWKQDDNAIQGRAAAPASSGFVENYGSLEEFEEVLNNQYDDERRECGYRQPAYECSGLLLRGLYRPGGTYYVPWSVSPKAKSRGNVLSFTYLRSDIGFERFPFNYTAGFIAYPTRRIPQNSRGQIPLKPLCQFPTDGYTDYRDEYGCGKTKEVVMSNWQNLANTDFSDRCHLVGVTSFYRWVRHLNKSHSQLFNQEQCGFDLRNVRYASQNSQISMRATQYYQEVTGTFRHSEIVTTGWPSEEEGLDVSKVPFMSFFFIEADKREESLQAAQRMQKDYYDRTGIFVPVTSIQLPTSSDDSAEIKVEEEYQHPEVLAAGVLNQ